MNCTSPRCPRPVRVIRRGARPRHRRGREPDRREDAGGPRRLRGDPALPRGARRRLRRRRRDGAVRGASAAARRPGLRHGPGAASRRQLRRTRGGVLAERRPACPRRSTSSRRRRVPLAALTAWGAVVDTARVHDGQRVLSTPERGGVGHFAVQFAALLRCDRHGDGLAAQRRVPARARRPTRHRLHDRALRRGRRRSGRRHRPRRQRARTTRAPARSTRCARAG